MCVLHGALRSGPGIGIAVFLCLFFFNAARPAWSSALPAWLHVYNHYVSTCDHTNSFKKCCCCLLLRSAIHSANKLTYQQILLMWPVHVSPVCVWEVIALRSPWAETAAFIDLVAKPAVGLCWSPLHCCLCFLSLFELQLVI